MDRLESEMESPWVEVLPSDAGLVIFLPQTDEQFSPLGLSFFIILFLLLIFDSDDEPPEGTTTSDVELHLRFPKPYLFLAPWDVLAKGTEGPNGGASRLRVPDFCQNAFRGLLLEAAILELPTSVTFPDFLASDRYPI